MILSQVVWFDTIVSGDVDLIDAYLENGWNVNHKRQDGSILIQEAIVKNKNELLLYLIEKGADLSHRLPNGDNLFHCAIRSHNPTAAELLVRNGFSLEEKTKGGLTPFHLALKIGAYNCLHLFVKDVTDLQLHKNTVRTSKNYVYSKYNQSFQVVFAGGPNYYMYLDLSKQKIIFPVYIEKWGKAERKILSILEKKGNK